MRNQRSFRVCMATVFSVAVLFAAEAGAQGRRAAPQAPQYDLKAEVTLQVTVTEIKLIDAPGGQGGVHLMVKAGLGSLEIELGPQWFLTDRKYGFTVGDALTVTGARVKDNKDALLAREIKRGDQTMTLRDAKGFPMWSGPGRGRGLR